MPISSYGANYFVTQYTSLDLWLALCSVTPIAGSTGATITEVAEADYAREYIDPAYWTTAANGLSTYAFVISYAPINDWGTINSWALLDSVTIGAGNVLSYGNFSPAIDVVSASYIELPTGSISVGVET